MLQQLTEVENEDFGSTIEDLMSKSSTIRLSDLEEKNHYEELQPSFLRGDGLSFYYDTPDTILSLDARYPDIMVYCKVCNEHIFIRNLPSHRKFHKKLMAFGYRESDRPTAKALLKRRNRFHSLIAETDSNIKLQKYSEINSTYEYLLNYLTRDADPVRHPPDSRHVPVEDVQSKALNCSLSSVRGVGVASSRNKEWKESMEDRCVYQDCFGNHQSKAYLAVFDGYDGSHAAQLASEDLHHALLNELKRCDPLVTCSCTYNMVDDKRREVHRPRTRASTRVALHMESSNLVQSIIHACEDRLDDRAKSHADQQVSSSNSDRTEIFQEDTHLGEDVDPTKSEPDSYSMKMTEIFRRSFHYTDGLLMRGDDKYSSVRWSGTHATTVLLNESIKPNNNRNTDSDRSDAESSECETKVYLANIGTSHAILIRNNLAYKITEEHSTKRKKERKRVVDRGGCLFKHNRDILLNGVFTHTRALGSHGEPDTKRCLTAEPHTVSVPIDEECQVLLIASSGLWTCLNESEVTGIISNELPCNGTFPDYSNNDIDELRRNPTPLSRSTASHGDIQFQDGSEHAEESNTSSVRQSDMETFSDTSDQISHFRSKSNTRLGTEWGKISTQAETRTNPFTRQNTDITSVDCLAAQHIATRLVQAALLAGSRENISVIVVLFQAALKVPQFIEKIEENIESPNSPLSLNDEF